MVKRLLLSIIVLLVLAGSTFGWFWIGSTTMKGDMGMSQSGTTAPTGGIDYDGAWSVYTSAWSAYTTAWE